MNLETNNISFDLVSDIDNISFDLVSELFIDKFNEKIEKLKDDEICEKMKVIKENDKIHIFVIRSNDKDSEDEYESDENIDEYFNKSDTYYTITINEFKANILEFQTTKVKTDFESILHSENTMASLVNEIIQEIKREISYIEITEYDTENYEKDIKNKPNYQELPDNAYPIKICTTKDNNSDKILIELTYNFNITFSAIYDNGNFTDITVKVQSYRYYGITKQIQKTAKALKAFQYYLYFQYYSYNNYTENRLYERKYKELIDELWGK